MKQIDEFITSNQFSNLNTDLTSNFQKIVVMIAITVRQQ
jgi:hypothetical protein